MDLLNLLRLLGRRWMVVVPLLLILGSLNAAMFVLTPPTYRASGAVILLNPPAPAAGTVENPLVRINDLSVVVDLVARKMRSEPVIATLREKGLDGEYTVAANIDFYRGPIIDIAAETGDNELALSDAKLVMAEVNEQLVDLQRQQGTDPAAFIRSEVVITPSHATTLLSNKLRILIATAGASVLVIIGLAVVVEAVSDRRTTRATTSLGSFDAFTRRY